MAPHDGVELAFINASAFEHFAGGGQAHVHDQRLGAGVAPALLGAARRSGEEVHGAQNTFACTPPKVVEHLAEANVPHAGCHAGITRFDITVADDGAGDMGAVPAFVHPQVRFIDSGPEAYEVGTADTLSVRRNVQVVDVQPAVHDGDGHGSAGRAGEQPRRALMAAQRIDPHGRHRGVMGGPHDADGFNGQHEILVGDGVQVSVGDVGGVGADVRVEATDLGAPVPPAGAASGPWGSSVIKVMNTGVRS